MAALRVSTLLNFFDAFMLNVLEAGVELVLLLVLLFDDGGGLECGKYFCSLEK